MAKVKIQGNASGTGVVTLTAPNTNADRTITLPDGTGELIQANASGNVGIGNATNNWENTAPVTSLDIGQGGKSSLFDYDSLTGNTQTILLNNSYYNSGYKYVGAGESSQYQQADGAHTFSSAPTGVADASMTNTVQMKIDSAGRVTMPYQPAFNAACGNGTNYSVSIAGSTKITFTQITDTNNNFASSRFTAPVSGMYQFNVNIEIDADASGRWGISLRKNSSHLHQAITLFTNGSGWDNTSFSRCIYLSTNDYIEVWTETVPSGAKYWSGIVNSNGDNGGFSGYLIG